MSNSSQNQANTLAQSPLVQIDLSAINTSAEALSVTEEAFLGHLNLRGSTDNAAFLTAAESVLGIALPLENNTFVSNGDLTVLWYGPNEWLLVTQSGAESVVLEKIRKATEGHFSAITDVSGGNTVLNISGRHAIEFLQKGCPMDLHRSVFQTGQCAQTVLAKAGMTIYKLAEPDQFKIIIRRSFSDYLGAWLIDAAQEFAD